MILVRSGEVRQGQARPGEVRGDQARLGKFVQSVVRLREVWQGRDKSGDVGKVWRGWERSGEVK